MSRGPPRIDPSGPQEILPRISVHRHRAWKIAWTRLAELEKRTWLCPWGRGRRRGGGSITQDPPGSMNSINGRGAVAGPGMEHDVKTGHPGPHGHLEPLTRTAQPAWLPWKFQVDARRVPGCSIKSRGWGLGKGPTCPETSNFHLSQATFNSQ